MRLAGLRSLLFGAFALLVVGTFPGCENPFDPLSESDKIQGLSYVDFAGTWDRWDSDSAYDGIVVTPEYYNEFGDSLSFHDKPHSVVIEFWTQTDIGTTESPYIAKGTLFFSTTIDFSNSDDTIRIPVEAYRDSIPADIIDPATGESKGFIAMRVFPPQEYPREELPISYPDQTFFKPEASEGTPNP